MKKKTNPLDVIGAETVGMIGYMIEQELGNIIPADDHIVTVLTQILVDPDDPAPSASPPRGRAGTGTGRRVQLCLTNRIEADRLGVAFASPSSADENCEVTRTPRVGSV